MLFHPRRCCRELVAEVSESWSHVDERSYGKLVYHTYLQYQISTLKRMEERHLLVSHSSYVSDLSPSRIYRRTSSSLPRIYLSWYVVVVPPANIARAHVAPSASRRASSSPGLTRPPSRNASSLPKSPPYRTIVNPGHLPPEDPPASGSCACRRTAEVLRALPALTSFGHLPGGVRIVSAGLMPPEDHGHSLHPLRIVSGNLHLPLAS